MRDAMKLIDPRPMNHGMRVAYLIYKMLQCTEKYEEYEMADIAMLVTFHDIGSYKTDNLAQLLKYESKETMPHSTYGYLFLRYLSPFGERAKALLYHHTDNTSLARMELEPEIRTVAALINVADKMDIYHKAMGDKFNYIILDKYAGSRLSADCLKLFKQAMEKEDLFQRIDDQSYLDELDTLFDNLIFTNEDKENYIRTIMYLLGFRSVRLVAAAAQSTGIGAELGKKMMLSKEEMKALYYASVLHDIGMMAVPLRLLNAPKKLPEEDMKKIEEHVKITDRLLRGRLKDTAADAAVTHHERCNGSGYPYHKKDAQFSTIQRILQTADMTASMATARRDRPAKSKQEICEILKSEVEQKKLNGQIVSLLTQGYDTIMERARNDSADVMAKFDKVKKAYEKVSRQF